MTYENKLFEKWVTNPNLDAKLREELLMIENKPQEIEDRFYKDLEFGTGGLRGIIGAGTNRMNIYTVSKATKGIGDFIVSLGKEAKQRGVVIAYDCRNMSYQFAKQIALVFCAMGIKVYLFDDLRPTPELSFAVRYLDAQAGVVVTASHNPSQYNGYKVYWQDGGQITDQLAKELITKIKNVEDCFCIKVAEEKEAVEKQLLQYIGEEIDRVYIEKVKGISLNTLEKDITIVYTPLHGTGLVPIKRVLKELNYNNVYILPSQENPDGSFSTVKSPNPEEPEALSLAIQYAAQVNADLVFGTDPDCDRIGVAVRDLNGSYQLINGNQTGALLVKYILSKKKEKLTDNDVIIKTIVTSNLGAVIAKKYGVRVEETLTGFKYIGEKIKEFEPTDNNFIFGYEESYGYLSGTFVRDKDAVIAAMLICEMANDYKEQGLNLLDALEDIYKEYGYYQEQLQSITLTGIEGIARIGKIMNCFRGNTKMTIDGFTISMINDYQTSISYNLKDNTKKIIQLPSSNVLKYISDDGSWIALRPSGTEPKLKIYYSVVQKKSDKLKSKLEIVMNGMNNIIQNIV